MGEALEHGVTCEGSRRMIRMFREELWLTEDAVSQVWRYPIRLSCDDPVMQRNYGF